MILRHRLSPSGTELDDGGSGAVLASANANTSITNVNVLVLNLARELSADGVAPQVAGFTTPGFGFSYRVKLGFDIQNQGSVMPTCLVRVRARLDGVNWVTVEDQQFLVGVAVSEGDVLIRRFETQTRAYALDPATESDDVEFSAQIIPILPDPIPALFLEAPPFAAVVPGNCYIEAEALG